MLQCAHRLSDETNIEIRQKKPEAYLLTSNRYERILFMHLSSIVLENFKDRSLIMSEILEFIELHTYKFGLVYMSMH